MTPAVIVGSSIAAVAVIAIVRSNIGWVSRAVIAGMLAASVGTLVIGRPSAAPLEAQRSLIVDNCNYIAGLLVSFRTDLRTHYPPGTKLPPYSDDPDSERWDRMYVPVTAGLQLCGPVSRSSWDFVERELTGGPDLHPVGPIGTTPEFMHGLDLLIDAFQRTGSKQ